MMKREILNCKIVRHIGTLLTSAKGWALELNEIKWNGRPAKLDLRDWSLEHDRSGKRNTLTAEEAKALVHLLEKEFVHDGE